MADAKVSSLVSATTLNLTDSMLLVQAGSSLKVDIETLALKMPSRIIINEASEALIVSGAVATNKRVTKIKCLTAGAAYTLAAGTHGMEKIVVCDVADVTTPTATLTITSGIGITTATFNAVGDTIKLQNIDGSWFVVGSNSVTIV